LSVCNVSPASRRGRPEGELLGVRHALPGHVPLAVSARVLLVVGHRARMHSRHLSRTPCPSTLRAVTCRSTNSTVSSVVSSMVCYHLPLIPLVDILQHIT